MNRADDLAFYLNVPTTCAGTRRTRRGHMTAPLWVLLCFPVQARALDGLISRSGGLK